METVYRFSHRLLPTPFAQKCLPNIAKTPSQITHLLRFHETRMPIFICRRSDPVPPSAANFIRRRAHSSLASPRRAGWFLGLREKKPVLPDIVKAGDPVLHEPAQDVQLGEIGSEKIQKIIDDMVMVMRKAPGVGLAAPQIGIPLRVILNPKLRRKGNKTALFFEGCLSVGGFRAVVERSLEVEVTGLGRDGKPIKVDASGWQARILQHECDHLDGVVYVDKMVPRTFRTVKNLDLPLAVGCPKLGVQG
ncbi:peptide deformylase 1A, chloroplastic isoform X2 [Malania oleifera]|uniref:peptide deformylase 1A, chloroplastic isoform X2 n=1 Tax=Malania oleifera TaxID=397392 RepID=UPI0025AE77F1|nr:peptide deformylase 1A, chloroplastic isoform X2 [Malania oleifera]